MKLIIIGAGLHAKVLYDLATKCGYEVLGYLDDFKPIGEDYFHKPILGKTTDIMDLYKKYNCEFIIARGDNKYREMIASTYDVPYATLIHPTACIGIDVEIGEGTVVLANSVINVCAKIGKHVIINTGAIVEHDNVIGDYVHLSPNAATGGSVHIGKRSHLGISSAVKNNITITDNCIIGMGSVVINDITEPGTYVGIPAKKQDDK